MATAEGRRSQGIGQAVLAAAIAHVCSSGGGLLWCNARVPAVTFYRRAGFTTRGEPWDEPDIGPHVVMYRVVATTPG
jgi:predicted GNAT family N-acyltransferase